MTGKWDKSGYENEILDLKTGEKGKRMQRTIFRIYLRDEFSPLAFRFTSTLLAVKSPLASVLPGCHPRLTRDRPGCPRAELCNRKPNALSHTAPEAFPCFPRAFPCFALPTSRSPRRAGAAPGASAHPRPPEARSAGARGPDRRSRPRGSGASGWSEQEETEDPRGAAPALGRAIRCAGRKAAYGGAPGGPTFPGQTQDPLYGYFAAVAGQDGQIDADELQRCLTQSGIAGGYKPFNLETCRLMVSMLDRDMSGTMGFNEFKELWAVLNGWRQHFISFDSDRSGTVDPQELQKALTTMGFRLSPQAVNSIAKRYSTNGKITFDDYIACCVKLRALTDSFRRRDTAQQGVVNFPYDDFIQCVMSV
nr:sorcin [Vulpes vulpes]